jgi:hypothetical protein
MSKHCDLNRSWARHSAWLLLLLPLWCGAVPVRWVFSGAHFNDGGSISGYFVYDADTDTYGDYGIAVSAGDVANFPPVTYVDGAGDISGYRPPPDNQYEVDIDLDTGPRQLRFSTLAPRTNAGGTLPLSTTTHSGNSGSVECFNCGPARIINSGSLTGTPLGVRFAGNAAITGNWFDPAQDGHGFQFEVLPGGIVTALWFTFDKNGNQVWIGAAGKLDHDAVVMQAGRVLNGRFPPNFNPATVTRSAWGTLSFYFTDCDHAKVDWVTNDAAFTASGSMSLQRLTHIDGLSCN